MSTSVSVLIAPRPHLSLLALEGFWLAKFKNELLKLPIAVDGPKHRSQVCVISHLVVLTVPLWTVKTDPESVVRGNL